jgi:hypothetical protein
MLLCGAVQSYGVLPRLGCPRDAHWQLALLVLVFARSGAVQLWTGTGMV